MIRDYVIRVICGDILETQRNPTSIKLADVNAPELDSREGKAVKEFLAGFIEGQSVSVEHVSKDESGRPVSKVWFAGLNINDYVNSYIQSSGTGLNSDTS